MESWLEMVIRQCMFYSLPVLVSLTLVNMIEAQLLKVTVPHPFYAISWKSAWWPLLIGIAMQRAVIIALPRPVQEAGMRGAAARWLGHGLCALAGFLLYQWALQHPPAAGLPPLHHWWAKVLMYFNLCMLALHVLPMPGMLLGEYLQQRGWLPPWWASLLSYLQHWCWLLLAASPLLDALCGQWLVYPLYEALATAASQ